MLAEANSWIGTPWRHAARLKGVGVDCAQFLIACYSAAGLVKAFEPEEYPIDIMFHRSEELFLKGLMDRCEAVDTPQKGDVGLWKFGRQFSHGGIVSSWPEIIHASRPDGMVLKGRGDGGFLADRAVLFFRA